MEKPNNVDKIGWARILRNHQGFSDEHLFLLKKPKEVSEIDEA